MAKEIQKNEFRKGNKKSSSSHPVHVYSQVGNQYKYIGITHADRTDGIDNILLTQNPEPNNETVAYIKSYPEKAHKDSFSDTLPGWKFNDKDMPNVELVKAKPIKEVTKLVENQSNTESAEKNEQQKNTNQTNNSLIKLRGKKKGRGKK